MNETEPQRSVSRVTQMVVAQLDEFWLDPDRMRMFIRGQLHDREWMCDEETRADVLAPFAKSVAALPAAHAVFVAVSFMSSISHAFRSVLPDQRQLADQYTEAVVRDLVLMLEEASR